MADSTITRDQTAALAKLAEIPPVGSEEREDVACHCNSSFGPNPECGACGGSGSVSESYAALAKGGARG